MSDSTMPLTRRRLFRDATLAGGVAVLPWFSAWAQPVNAGQTAGPALGARLWVVTGDRK